METAGLKLVGLWDPRGTIKVVNYTQVPEGLATRDTLGSGA